MITKDFTSTLYMSLEQGGVGLGVDKSLASKNFGEESHLQKLQELIQLEYVPQTTYPVYSKYCQYRLYTCSKLLFGS